jgi:hypothetical protein
MFLGWERDPETGLVINNTTSTSRKKEKEQEDEAQARIG